MNQELNNSTKFCNRAVQNVPAHLLYTELWNKIKLKMTTVCVVWCVCGVCGVCGMWCVCGYVCVVCVVRVVCVVCSVCGVWCVL